MAVRNLRRFDQTFVHTAFGRHASGLAVSALPTDLSAMREVSYASAVDLLTRLRTFFDHQLVDLGGFSNLEFVAQWSGRQTTYGWSAIRTWHRRCPRCSCSKACARIMTNPRLTQQQTNGSRNFRPPTCNWSSANSTHPCTRCRADCVALGLPLLSVLPARAQALGRAVNQGRLLAEAAERDPYVRALDPLVAKLRAQSFLRRRCRPGAHRSTYRTAAPGSGAVLTTLLKRS